MVEILGQLVEFEAVGDAVHTPGFGMGFEGAQKDLARVLLVIGAFVGDAQDRHGGQARDRLGHDVEMFASVERHVDAGHAAHLVPPHAGAVDDHVTGDVPRRVILGLPVDAGDAAARAGEGGDFHPLADQRAILARALGQCLGDIGGVALPVGGQPETARHAVDIEMFVALLDLRWGQFLDRDAEGTGHCGGAEHLFAPLFGQRGRDRAAAAEACFDAGFLAQRTIEFLRVFRETCHVGRRAQLPDQPRRVPCRARGDPLAFQKHHIRPTQFGEVIGNRTADHAAADDHDAGVCGKGAHLDASRNGKLCRLISGAVSGVNGFS